MKYNGSVDQYTVKVGRKDITERVQGFDITGDVFSPGWSAVFSIDDPENLIANVPIKEMTKIDVSVKTDVTLPCGGMTKRFEFYIIQIKDQVYLNRHYQQYKLIAVDYAVIKDMHEMVFKSFKSSLSFNAASSIIKTYLPGYAISGDADDQPSDFIIQSKSPLSAIMWTTRFAIKDRSPDYLFFQNDNKSYRYASFEKMYSAAPIFKLRMAVQNVLTESGDYRAEDYLSILEYKIHRFNAAQEMVSGQHANTAVSVNHRSRKYEYKRFDFGDDNASDKTVKPFDMSANNPASTIYAPSSGSGPFSNIAWMSARMSALMKLDQNRMTVRLYGSVCLTEKLGKAIQVDVPPVEDISGSRTDKYLAGKYIISAFKLSVAPRHCFINLELTKKRLEIKP